MGDGYYIGREFFTTLPNAVEHVTLYEPEAYNSSRNDISLCHGHDIKIIRPRGEGTFRTSPGAAIDIEPEFGDTAAVQPTLRRVLIDSPVSVGKVSGILTVFNRPISDWDVSIVGTAVDYDSSTPLQLIRTEDMIDSVGSLTIDEFRTVNSFGNPLFYSWFADNTCKVDIGRLLYTKAISWLDYLLVLFLTGGGASKVVTKPILGAIKGGAKIGGGFGAGFGLSSALQDDKSLSNIAKDTAASGAMGAVAGAVISGGIAAASIGGQNLVNRAKKHSQDMKNSLGKYAQGKLESTSKELVKTKRCYLL